MFPIKKLLCVSLCLTMLVFCGCRKKQEEGEKPVTGVNTPKSETAALPLVATHGGDTPVTPAATETIPQEPVQPIFDKMVKAYRDARSYQDNGEIQILWTIGEKKWQRKIKCRTNLQRPNRVQLSVENTVINADGKDFTAYTDLHPGVIIRRKCPAEITLLDLLCDREIYRGLVNAETSRFSFLPPPLVLLFAKDPLATFLYDVQASDISMLPQGKTGGFTCYRISAKRNGEETIFWIDAETSILRRVELPTERLRKEMATSGTTMDSLTLTMDFHDARLNADDAQIQETVQIPADAREVENFAPPQLELLGKPVPEFAFTDKDGKSVTPASLKGKTAVIIFWATYGKQFGLIFQQIEKAYRQLKTDPGVVFLAVSVDPATETTETLRKALKDFGSTVPLARDPDGKAMEAFKTPGIMTMFLVDKDGIVQAFTPDYSPNMADRMVARVREVQAGLRIYPEVANQVAKLQQDYLEGIARWIDAGVFLDPGDVAPVTVPEMHIAPASSPTAFALAPLWKAEELNGPGNILVIPAATEQADDRVFVLENGRAVTELDAAGKVKTRHELAVAPEDFQLGLTSAVMPGTGNRVFATFGRRVHLFDENWQLISRHPDVPDKELPNILADVVLCDLDRDRKLEVYVSFWEGKGVHKVSLEGELLARLPELETVFQMAPVRDLGPLLPTTVGATAELDAEIHRAGAPAVRPGLVCVNRSGSLILVDSDLRQLGQLQVKDRTMGWVIAADLTGDGEETLAGMSLGVGGQYKALGLTPAGKEMWSLDLPVGVYLRPLDRFFAVHLQKPFRSSGQWLVLGADSSLHLISSDGIILDQFHVGSVITGVASAILGGKPVLLISTQETVQAMEVKWRE